MLADLLGAEARPTPTLSLTDCVKELDGWLRHRRLKAWQRNRTSLLFEVEVASSAVAPHLASALAPMLERYVERVQALPPKPRPDEVHSAATIGQSLLAVAATPDAIRGAWLDLVESTGAASAPVRAAEACYHQLMSLIEAAGHDAQDVRKRLAGVLNDDALQVLSARVALGDTEGQQSWPDPYDDAGLDPDARMELCGRLLSAPAPSGRCITWHAFASAQLDSSVLKLGHVTLLEARWALPNALEEGGQRFPGRSELKSNDVPRRFDEIGDDRRVALARVDLGNRPAAGALEFGRQTVRAVADIAAWEGNGARWQEYGWEMLLVDGVRRLTTSYVPAEAQKQWISDLDYDRTAAALQERGSAVAAALASGALPADLAEALRSATEATDADVRSRIILDHRVTEMVASFGSLEADAFVGRLAPTWPAAALDTRMVNVIARALSPGFGHDEKTYKELTELAAVIRQARGSASFTLDLEAAAAHADRLLHLWDGTRLERELAEVFDILNKPEAYLRGLTNHEEEAGVMQRRLRRVRNALTHGNPVHDAAVASVEGFSRYLANAALQVGLDAYFAGSTITELLDSRRARFDKIVAAVRVGHSYLSQLA